MTTKVGAILVVNGPNATCFKLQSNILERNAITLLECQKCLAALKRYWLSGFSDSADDVFVN